MGILGRTSDKTVESVFNSLQSSALKVSELCKQGITVVQSTDLELNTTPRFLSYGDSDTQFPRISIGK